MFFLHWFREWILKLEQSLYISDFLILFYFLQVILKRDLLFLLNTHPVKKNMQWSKPYNNIYETGHHWVRNHGFEW